jgi:hypothetical protein
MSVFWVTVFMLRHYSSELQEIQNARKEREKVELMGEERV